MAFARMARWAEDLTLLLAPGVKLNEVSLYVYKRYT
jgi:hypothetical protein